SAISGCFGEHFQLTGRSAFTVAWFPPTLEFDLVALQRCPGDEAVNISYIVGVVVLIIVVYCYSTSCFTWSDRGSLRDSTGRLQREGLPDKPYITIAVRRQPGYLNSTGPPG
ncbi:MAG TPA: hypothetical protein VIP52_01775, partial [Candidatus Dormibacteraeota bacterium]